MKNLFTIITFFSLMISSCGSKSVPTSKPQPTPVKDELKRGFNTTSHLTEQDVIDLKNYNVNLLRLAFGYHKLVSKDPPYNYNETEFEQLDRAINLCKQYGIRVVIDPHTAPGFAGDYTTSYKDEFWGNKELQDKFVELWKKLSDRYKNYGDVIWGYDLLNEPFVSDPVIYSDLVDRLVKTIRDNGDNHPIIIESYSLQNAAGYKKRNSTLKDLRLPGDKNIIVSTHFYELHEYTHQVVIPKYERLSYNDPKLNSKAALLEDVELIRSFQLKNPGIPIYLGEFSVARIATDGDEYVKDLIDACEKYGWHWTFHSFREAYVWDPEMPLGSNDKATRSSTASRITLLKTYFAKNKLAK